MLKEIPKVELSVSQVTQVPTKQCSGLAACAGEADHPLGGQRASQGERLRGTTGDPSLGGRNREAVRKKVLGFFVA